MNKKEPKYIQIEPHKPKNAIFLDNLRAIREATGLGFKNIIVMAVAHYAKQVTK